MGDLLRSLWDTTAVIAMGWLGEVQYEQLGHDRIEFGGMAERSAIQTSPAVAVGAGLSSAPPVSRYRANATSSSSYCVALPSTDASRTLRAPS